MVKRFLLWVRDEPLGRIGVLIALLAIFSVGSYGLYLTQTSPEQPIQFPHNLHVGLGIQCLYCHPGSLRGPMSGLPTETKCWGCHQQLAKYADPAVQWPPELAKLKKYVESGQPIPWVPVAQVPDFVHFNHRPHIAAGLNCENCHGDMSKLTVAQNPQVMNMGWCINCHRARTVNDPVKRTKLTDCGTCHY
jgi:hypothetical protein